MATLLSINCIQYLTLCRTNNNRFRFFVMSTDDILYDCNNIMIIKKDY